MVILPPASIKVPGWNMRLETERWKRMGVLDDLIRIKSNKQEDDLLKMLDEIPVYEKLSVDEKLKDLKNSAVTRAKCPMLAAFIDGKLYETVLAELVSNVYLQIEGNIPEILSAATEKSLKQQRQMEILKDSIVHVEYRALTEYDHKMMKDRLAAVFTKPYQDIVMAVLIIKEPDTYTMYHGTYEVKEGDISNMNVSEPLITKGKRGILAMDSYSVLGNDGYRFASYRNSHISYDIMIGPDGLMYFLNGNHTEMTFPIPESQRNHLNLAKKCPEEFAGLLTAIIEDVIGS